eukprot:10943670-Alexandrium_andersonii.AAC.1
MPHNKLCRDALFQSAWTLLSACCTLGARSIAVRCKMIACCRGPNARADTRLWGVEPKSST